MKYPRLVRSTKTPCEVVILSEPDEYGEEQVLFSDNLLCNMQSSHKIVYTADKHEILLSAVLLFDGDFAPDIETLGNGTVKVKGITHSIVTGSKCRNPDGSVNYIKLEVK